MDARRTLLKARSYWNPLILDLHRFMIAVARVAVDHDGRGGTALIPLSGIRVVSRKLANLLFGLMLICPSSWPSWWSHFWY